MDAERPDPNDLPKRSFWQLAIDHLGYRPHESAGAYVLRAQRNIFGALAVGSAIVSREVHHVSLDDALSFGGYALIAELARRFAGGVPRHQAERPQG